MIYKEHTNCRVCGSQKLTSYLDLGKLPLSNNLGLSTDDPVHEQAYPLVVMLCEECGLSQLSIVIPPEELFKHYVYRSSISNGYKNHCRDMAKDLKSAYGLSEESFCIDIAGNDGALLREFKDIIGCKVLNVDPAQNLYNICEESGVGMFCTFWSIEAAKHLQSTFWPKADIITATNVFAHVDNVTEFLEAVKIALDPTGKLVLEFPYLIDFINKLEFDTVYFEHLSYFSIGPLKHLCDKVGLTIEHISRHDIHGGSVRVIIGYGEQGKMVDEFIQQEKPYKRIDIYNSFASAVKKTIDQFAANVKDTTNIAGFAASAKGNTLLNCAGVSLKYIVDQTPEKIGKFSPGNKTQIVSIDRLVEDPPEFLIILSWNFADEIITKCKAVGYTGKFIVPIPSWQILS